MPLLPHEDAVLVLDAADAEETGTYAIYSIRPDENERFMRGEWKAMKASLAPTGHVPVTDVEFDEATGLASGRSESNASRRPAAAEPSQQRTRVTALARVAR